MESSTRRTTSPVDVARHALGWRNISIKQRTMESAKLAAGHRRLPGMCWPSIPLAAPTSSSRSAEDAAVGDGLPQRRCDDLRERVSGPVQTRFHRAQVAVGDFGDLLVRPTLEFTEDKHVAVVPGQPGDRLGHGIPQVPESICLIGPGAGIFELERALFIVVVRRQRREHHERASGAIAQLVLRQVGRDRVDPGRELLCPIEAAQVPVHADEGLLHEVFRPLTVANDTVHEVQKAPLVSLDQFSKSERVAFEVRADDMSVIHGAQLRPVRVLALDKFGCPRCCLHHLAPRRV